MNTSVECAQYSNTVAPAEQHIICVDDDANFLKSMSFVLQEKLQSDTSAGVWYRYSFMDNPLQAFEMVKELVEE